MHDPGALLRGQDARLTFGSAFSAGRRERRWTHSGGAACRARGLMWMALLVTTTCSGRATFRMHCHQPQLWQHARWFCRC